MGFLKAALFLLATSIIAILAVNLVPLLPEVNAFVQSKDVTNNIPIFGLIFVAIVILWPILTRIEIRESLSLVNNQLVVAKKAGIAIRNERDELLKARPTIDEVTEDYQNKIASILKLMHGKVNSFDALSDSSKGLLSKSEDINHRYTQMVTNLSQLSKVIENQPEQVKKVFTKIDDTDKLAEVLSAVTLLGSKVTSNRERMLVESIMELKQKYGVASREFLFSSWVLGKTFKGNGFGEAVQKAVENLLSELVYTESDEEKSEGGIHIAIG